MPAVWSHELDDHAVDLRWSVGGDYLAAMPSVGRIAVYEADGTVCALLPGHPGGNGAIAWHPRNAILATYGQDATIQLYEVPFTAPPRSIVLDKGWADRLAWNPDGTLLAAGVGKSLFILDGTTGTVLHTFDDHKSTICDLAWNPKCLNEISTVCDGGARMWRIGQRKPFGHFDWGGASLIVTWSPNGRWVVTGDQTPSVHLYDTGRNHPLHIQGYETKVKALAWEGTGEWLASGGGSAVTVWPCTGKKGPEGVKPIQLFGHINDAQALDFAPHQSILVSGGRDGLVLLWMPHRSPDPALIAQHSGEITVVRWSPDGQCLAYGTADGTITLTKLMASPAPA